jgi:hypothetical protein
VLDTSRFNKAEIFSFGKISGTSIQNDVYSVRFKLENPIPEYLPIRGKKAKIYYHGMLPFCSNCYIVGHLTVDCVNETSTWWDYIAKLKGCEIPDEFFGSWFENPKLVSQSTPNSKETDIKAQFISFMQEFVRNPTSISSTPPQSPIPTGSGAKKTRFDSLYQWTPAIKAQIEAEKQKQKKNNQKKKNQANQAPRGGRGGQGGRGGRGGRGGGPRGGRGGRGRGAAAVAT